MVSEQPQVASIGQRLLGLVDESRFRHRTRGLWALRQLHDEFLKTTPSVECTRAENAFALENGIGRTIEVVAHFLDPASRELNGGLFLVEFLMHAYRDEPDRFVRRVEHYHVDAYELVTRIALAYLVSGELQLAFEFGASGYIVRADPRCLWIAAVAAKGSLEPGSTLPAEQLLFHPPLHETWHPAHDRYLSDARRIVEDPTWTETRMAETLDVYRVRRVRDLGIEVAGRHVASARWKEPRTGRRCPHPEHRVLDWMLRWYAKARPWNMRTRGPLGGLPGNHLRKVISSLRKKLPDNFVEMTALPANQRRRVPRIRARVPLLPTALPQTLEPTVVRTPYASADSTPITRPPDRWWSTPFPRP